MSENKYENLLNEWEKYDETSKKVNDNDKNILDDCFENYIENIKNQKFTLENYAGPIKEGTCTYFCTFIERKSMNPYGYARVGNMYQYGISYVAEKQQYYINDSLVEEKSRTPKYSPVKNGKELQPISVYDKNIAESIFDNKIKSYLEEIVKEVGQNNIEEISAKIDRKELNPIDTKQFFRKIIAMNNKGKFLFIYNDTIDTVYNFFVKNSNEKDDLSNLEKNFKIVQRLRELGFKKLNRHEDDDAFIIELSSFIWKKFNTTLNFESKNTILHGAPGTGKTYMTESSIENYLNMETNQDINKQFKLQQFHPSFGYEEFIDGIKPTKLKSTDNGIQLELVNGSFKEMCIMAFKELIRAVKEGGKPKNYYYVADEINRAELSRVFGELLLCLEEDKRLKVEKKEDNKLLVSGSKVQTQNASLWEKEHAVVILDENNYIIDLDENNNYLKDGTKYFGVPENLYFIGTMNDIDKSVDSFDIALRRRFIWKHYSYQREVLENHYGEKEQIDEFLAKCENLNDYITSEIGFNLSEAYILGHSYFMNLPSFSNEQLKKLWSNKIEPLLTEYGRVNYEGKELLEKLECSKKRFLNMKLSDKCK